MTDNFSEEGLPAVLPDCAGTDFFVCGYEDFKHDFLTLSGIDLNCYKEKQMRRRINTLIIKKGFSGYAEYFAALNEDPAELASFVDYITINVTEFFRVKEHWTCFEETVLKKLAENRTEPLKIWSCACAAGEEAYSAAMSAADLLPCGLIKVTASDIDVNVLSKAEKGIFAESSMGNVDDGKKQAYFRKEEDGWHISPEIKNCVEFHRLDLLKDKYPQEQDVILCRNVLIYLTEAAQDTIYRRLYDSLAAGGVLFTGNAERIIQYRKYGFIRQDAYLYRKPGRCG